jgi:hypothetical protein
MIDSSLSRSANLLDLPEDLLIRILHHLPLATLISCLSTCRNLNNVITQSTLLQYTMALECHGLTNNPDRNCLLSLAERLRLLRAREEAWRWFNINFVEQIDVEHSSSLILELTGGVCVLGDSVTRETIIAPDLSTTWNTKALMSVVLPTEEGAPSERTWNKITGNPGIDILDIGVAIQEHNLIALVTM